MKTKESTYQRRQRLRRAALGVRVSPLASSPCATLDLLAFTKGYRDEEWRKISLDARQAWLNICNGAGDSHDLQELIQITNTSMVRCESIEPTWLAECTAHQHAINTLRMRFEATGSTTPCHVTLKAIPQMLLLYEDILQLSTPLQMVKAVHEASRRQDQRHVLQEN